MIDSHCHLNMVTAHEKTPMELSALLAEAKSYNIEKLLSVSVDTGSWDEMKSLCANHPDFIKLSAGIHPCYVEDQNFDLLTQQLQDTQVVAVGESGLDYYYEKEPSGQQRQRDSFAKHIALSAEYEKPLIVHTRDARDDTIAVMRAEGAERGSGVMHCFTEDISMAKAALDLGFYISFSGVITFKNAQQIRDVCAFVPTDRILIETDSPYLAPVPYRGKMNQPAYVHYVAEQVADVKNLTTQAVSKITTENFYRLFPLAA